MDGKRNNKTFHASVHIFGFVHKIYYLYVLRQQQVLMAKVKILLISLFGSYIEIQDSLIRQTSFPSNFVRNVLNLCLL